MEPLYEKHEAYLRYILNRFMRHEPDLISETFAEANYGRVVENFIRKQPRAVVGVVFHPSTRDILAVTRPKRPEDWGLPGGKVELGEVPEDAVMREVQEETGLHCVSPQYVYEREDTTDGRVVWAFTLQRTTKAFVKDLERFTEGFPRQREAGIDVGWKRPEELLTSKCTFAEYNRGLFGALGLI